jgi:hypothetical protein
MDEMGWESFILIVCEEGATDRIVERLREAGVHFTLHRGMLGVGDTGRREGSPVWPGTNDLVFCCMSQSQAAPLVAELKAMHDSRPDHSLGLKVFALPVQELV